jgi:hypothetical protein
MADVTSACSRNVPLFTSDVIIPIAKLNVSA